METRSCQNCKEDFKISQDDFGFYERIKVPPPTFCPDCRRQRRLVWRNERVLYKRNCDMCGKSIISMYHNSVPFPVYCRECWYGDKWDPKSYGRDYDFDKPFFDQYKELSDIVPRMALWQRNSINSDFSNFCAESRNVYLSTSVVKGSENVYYSKSIDKSKDIIDSMNVITSSEQLYENVEAQSNYNSQFLLLCRACIDSYYLVDCINCSNCFMCSNLRNKEYCVRNKQCTKEEYFKEIKSLNLKSRLVRQKLKQEFEELKRKAIYRYGNINKAVNSTGNNLLNVKNCLNCFEIYEAENVNYAYRGFDLKDCMDFDYGANSELIYEYTTGSLNNYNLKFSYSAMDSVRNSDYTESCQNSVNLFGCIAMRSAENAILNKVYPKTEFDDLRSRIIEQMAKIPFVDRGGRTYSYGEFFPIEISPWAYNETLAYEFFPITKEQAQNKGYSWLEQESKNFDITISAENIPDDIDRIQEDILKQVLECAHKGKCDHQCNTAFRLTDYELKFYKKHDIPLPVLCPNCRYHERLAAMPGFKLYERSCMCDKKNHEHKTACSNKFQSAYSPDRAEIVYCESCYNKEVY